MNAPLKMIKGSDNVFRDLGFPEGEGQNLLLRSDLMIKIEQLVKKSGLVQSDAAALLGITQPRMNDLLKGKIEKFSLDALVNMLARAGKEVTMTVKTSRATAKPMPKRVPLEREIKRDLGAELLVSARQMKSKRTGKIHKVSISTAKRSPQAQRKAA